MVGKLCMPSGGQKTLFKVNYAIYVFANLCMTHASTLHTRLVGWLWRCEMFKITGHISSFQTLFGSVLRKFALKDFV